VLHTREAPWSFGEARGGGITGDNGGLAEAITSKPRFAPLSDGNDGLGEAGAPMGR
jgi:hypothetical protein